MITALRSANAGSPLSGTARTTPSQEREGQKDKQEGKQDIVQVRDEEGEAEQTEHPGKQRGETTDRGDDRTPYSRLECFSVCHSISLLDLFQGVGPVRVGNALLHAVALDDVTRSYIVGQNNCFLADDAARCFEGCHRPDSVFFARPEREARSVGAVEDFTASDPDRELDLLSSAVAGCPRHRSSPSAAPCGTRYVMPRSRSILPRSKPTITSPSMTVTGVARSPSFSSSSSACGSSRMFFAMNWIPF